MIKHTTLRKQFSVRMISILLVITLISGIIQIFVMNRQMDYEIEKQSFMISKSISQGINETNLAATSIEHQIDLKITEQSKRIAEMLNTKKIDDITNEKLNVIKEELSLSDISLFVRKDNNFVVVRATDPEEIGFTFDQPDIIQSTEVMFKNEDPAVPGLYTEKGLVVLPIMRSGVHENSYYKYAYYHPEGADFLINPYITSDEVYKFTEEVGPNSWIEKMKEENTYVKEIAVIDPHVVQNPELADQFFPPLKKIVYGDYQYESEDDKEIFIKMLESPNKQSFVQKVNGEKVLKLFYPTETNQVIMLVLDYKELTGPIIRHSLILLITGIVSLISLLLLIVRFFNNIYENIKNITNQIEALEKGDLTAHSTINDGSELGRLSETTNRMVDRLNKLVKDTQEQATKTQGLSVLLEAEASQSVEKMYELSTEATIKSREQLYDISTFLDEVVEVLLPYKEDVHVQSVVERIDLMRNIANERTAATTDMTITLSDLLKSLHGQSSELSDISNTLLGQMGKFKL
ncbi:HAMP domain-containing protein [Sporosarcina sp. 179-K 8C2 HS]|uniref:HAMP domain-containing protein n=1 Tax=Sporosarcina sp. 179-K 8C2 HS TaxID=3142387 RepID=UPI0039A168AD